MEKRFAIILGVIAAGALFGRVFYVLKLPNTQKSTYDQWYFKTEAIALANGRGFELPAYGLGLLGSGEHPPMTAIVLAPVANLTNGNDSVLRLTVAVAGSATVVLAALIGREIGGHNIGLLAALLAALYPNLWVNDALLLPETFATLAAALVIFCTYRCIRMPKWTDAAGAGVACGGAALCRAELALLLPFLVAPAVLMLDRLTRVQRLRLVAGAVVAAALVVAPWEGYLLTRFERPTFISYSDGGVLAGANCSDTYYGVLIGSWNGFCGVNGTSNDPSVNAEGERRKGLAYMRGHLSRLPVVVAARVARVWSLYRPFQLADFSVAEGRPKWVSVLGLVMYWALVPLAIGGALLLWRRKVALVPLFAPVVIVTIVAAAFYGIVRFRAPAEISLVLLAAVALDDRLTAVSRRKRGRREDVLVPPSNLRATTRRRQRPFVVHPRFL